MADVYVVTPLGGGLFYLGISFTRDAKRPEARYPLGYPALRTKRLTIDSIDYFLQNTK
jgi:hypothetical protein